MKLATALHILFLCSACTNYNQVPSFELEQFYSHTAESMVTEEDVKLFKSEIIETVNKIANTLLEDVSDTNFLEVIDEFKTNYTHRIENTDFRPCLVQGNKKLIIEQVGTGGLILTQDELGFNLNWKNTDSSEERQRSIGKTVISECNILDDIHKRALELIDLTYPI